jgi:hypothetical protein
VQSSWQRGLRDTRGREASRRGRFGTLVNGNPLRANAERCAEDGIVDADKVRIIPKMATRTRVVFIRPLSWDGEAALITSLASKSIFPVVDTDELRRG